MSVYVDPTGHMTADTVRECLVFGARIGLLPQWFQWGRRRRHPHFDLTTARMRDKAQKQGAILVSSRQLAKAAGKIGIRKSGADDKVV